MSIATLIAFLRKILLRLRPPHPPAAERILTRWIPLHEK
jgi:hypothetical protein